MIKSRHSNIEKALFWLQTVYFDTGIMDLKQYFVTSLKVFKQYVKYFMKTVVTVSTATALLFTIIFRGFTILNTNNVRILCNVDLSESEVNSISQRRDD